jgi:peroxiredoxin
MLRIQVAFIIFSLLFTDIISADQNEIKPLRAGTPAPDFYLQGIDGKIYSLASFRDADILVIIFTANHCPTAQAYEERIIKLDKDYRPKSVRVVAVSSNNPEALRLDEMGYTDLGDSMAEMKIRAEERNFQFPYLYDGDEQQMARAYGAQSTPHVFILDGKRVIRFAGRIDDNENPQKVTQHDTRNAIEALLSGKEVPVKETKTFGCSIKWKYKKATVQEANERWQAEQVDLNILELSDMAGLLKNDTNNLLLINFWATWCGPCVAEFPDLIDVFRMYRNRDFNLITISLDKPDMQKSVLKFLQKNHASSINYQVNTDNTYAVIDAVGSGWSGAIPFTLLIKPGGEIIYKNTGMVDVLPLKKAIVGYLGRYYFKEE